MVVAIVQYNAVDSNISGWAYDTIKAMTNEGLGTPNERKCRSNKYKNCKCQARKPDKGKIQQPL